MASVGCAGIDDARAVLTQDAVVVVDSAITAKSHCQVASMHSRAALPVGRAAEQLAATVPDFVDVVGRKMQVGQVEHHVVR